MKKAFTLLELLAVIVILGILVVLAVPKVTDIIETAKIKTYKSNEEVVIKSVKTYLTLNEELLPKEIGETTEITFEQLQNEKYMNQITDSKGLCDGYILVTKTEEDYEYIPHIKCGESNTISSSTEDGLIAHYTFDDFQEPTENLCSNINLHTMNSSINYEYIGEENGWHKYSISGEGPETTYPYTMNINPSPINSEFPTTFSFEYKTNVPEKYTTELSSPRMVNIYYKAGYKVIDKKQEDYRKGIIESVAPLSLTNGTPIIGEREESIYFLSRAVPGVIFEPQTDFVYFRKVQAEKKPYSTPFVDGIRQGIIKDYSSNDKNITLNLENTPRWLIENNNGYYQFDGISDNIYATNMFDNLKFESITISSWFKNNERKDYDCIFFINKIRTYVVSGNIIRTIITTEENNTAEGYSDKTVNSNNEGWNNITITYDGLNFKSYIDGNLEKSLCFEIEGNVSNTGKISLGKYSDSYPHYFNGSIDDIKIYNRALSEEEIKYDYDMNKYKYE